MVGIAFFEASALFILLVLLLLLQREHRPSSFRTWLTGWSLLLAAGVAGLLSLVLPAGFLNLRPLSATLECVAFVFFLAAAVQHSSGLRQPNWQLLSLVFLTAAGLMYLEVRTPQPYSSLRWETAILRSLLALAVGSLLYRRSSARRGVSLGLLAGAFLLSGLHGLDRPLWPQHPFYAVRVAFGGLLYVAIGTAMAIFVLENARARAEELNDKLKRITLLTTATTQSFSVKNLLDKVLASLVESLGATHGAVRLLEGAGDSAELVLKSAVGFQPDLVEKYARLSTREPWVQRVLSKDVVVHLLDTEVDGFTRQRMVDAGLYQLVTVPLPGVDGALGALAVGSSRPVKFPSDEIAFMNNVANLLGLTLLNVRLFEQLSVVQNQWRYTFDSIGDPVFVHDRENRIVRTNQRLSHILGKETTTMSGRAIAELFPRREASYEHCPYCEGVAGGGDDPDPWLGGYFLASNSTFADPEGRRLGIVHVLKDITERKRAEEKYRSLISNVQEGVFISTPQGRFLDFNDAMLNIAGYDRRDDLMAASIPSLYVNAGDRERLKKLLQEHGAVADFEFEMRRKDGEIRTVLESSIAVRDAAGEVMAYQGFILDITERKRAEQEIRRRNRELMVLNSIAQTLSESLDLKSSGQRALGQLAELFQLDAVSLYLLDDKECALNRITSVGHLTALSRNTASFTIHPELLQHVRALKATFLSTQGLSLPRAFREVEAEEGIVTAYLVVLWSKDRVIGGLSVGSRTPREFSAADVNLLIAVGAQFSSAIERSRLFEQTRQAYDDLRRTQEQLLHSEKMAAVGQLISGVAHELNNPLTAILGYSQLLSASGQVGAQATEYCAKLHKQAQRTHRIVQNLLSFARQHKPERVLVQINRVIEDALALREYDLRVGNIRLHPHLAGDLPLTAADPHQLQQVFLNLVNNAVDAILERSREGDIWVSTALRDERLVIEFADSGPGVQDPSRVFDPFYTTKPVGKGTGLGLSICYGIILEHGGSISVRNDPPRGAVFTIELPQRLSVEVERPAPPEVATASRSARILLIDDDESVLEAVGETLRANKHFVHTVRDLEHARWRLNESEYDLVLVDSRLPGNNGGEDFLRWLEKMKPSLARRIVLMRSALADGSSGNSPLANCPVLQKPFKASELMAIVEEVLNAAHSPSLSR